MALDTLTQIAVFIFVILMIIIISLDLITSNKVKQKLHSVAKCSQCEDRVEIFCNNGSCHTPYCRTCYNKKGFCIVCKSNSSRPINANDFTLTSVGYSIIGLGIILFLISSYIDLSPIFSIPELINLTRLTISIISLFPLSVGLRKITNYIKYTLKPLLSN